MHPGLRLALADGRRWLIRPVDGEAAAVVAELGRVMNLARGDAGRELHVAVSGESDPAVTESGDAVACRLPRATNRDLRAIQMELVAAVVARDTLARGGLLLHGALAERRGSGFILAGPGTAGKSTASRRLPAPWRSLCDDTTLVVRDRAGNYRAHPWPTWSVFHFGGPGDGSWAVEQAVPLRAIFFLEQAPADRLEPVNVTQAAALVLESAVDLARERHRLSGQRAGRELCDRAISAARALVSAVPAYSLRLSLDGRFWEEIERVLPGTEEALPTAPAGADLQVSGIRGETARVVYTGTSMNPTLVEPELLEVEPYGTARVRPGDVACFKSPEGDIMVVHRVVAVDDDGVRTRGDNCADDDHWALAPGDIIGRVRAAQRGTRRRAIAGGRAGLAAARRARLGRFVRRCAGSVPHALYALLARLGPFDRLLPGRLRPRLVRFDTRNLVFAKLLVGGRVVGNYDRRRREWRIRRPFRLFVSERSLPVGLEWDDGR